MIHPPQVRPEEPIAVTPHDGICGGESQQWLSYPTNPHVRFDERGWETERCRMAQATAPVLDSTCAPTARITSGRPARPCTGPTSTGALGVTASAAGRSGVGSGARITGLPPPRASSAPG